MGQYNEIKRRFQELRGNQITLPVTGEVISVEGTSCSVRIVGGMDIPDVRLRASLSESENELLLVPTLGSKALICSVTGSLDDMVLLKADSYEKISYKQDELEILIDSASGMITAKKGDVSLKSLMGEIHDIISGLVVLTPNGPSEGLDQSAITSLGVFKTNLGKLLND